MLDLFQAAKVLHSKQPLRGTSDLQELQIVDVSNANGKHLNPHFPETVSCILHIILRFTVRDQHQILGDLGRYTGAR